MHYVASSECHRRWQGVLRYVLYASLMLFLLESLKLGALRHAKSLIQSRLLPLARLVFLTDKATGALFVNQFFNTGGIGSLLMANTSFKSDHIDGLIELLPPGTTGL